MSVVREVAEFFRNVAQDDLDPALVLRGALIEVGVVESQVPLRVKMLCGWLREVWILWNPPGRLNRREGYQEATIPSHGYRGSS